MKAELFGLVFALVAIETVGQTLARKYYDNKDKLWMFMLGVVCYIFILYILVKTYDLENIGFINALWSGLALVTIALVGYFFFEEEFNYMEYIGIGLILSGTVLLGFQK